MRWKHAIFAAAVLLVAGLARAEDSEHVREVMHEALLQHATLPSAPPMLPDRDTVLPGARPDRTRPGTRPTSPRGSPAREPGRPGTPNGMHDGRGALAAHGARDGSAMRDGMRASMANAAQSRTMMHAARDANAMRGEAAHRSSMGFGMGAMPGMTGQQGGWSGNWGCQDGAGMWRTMNPNGGMMDGRMMDRGGGGGSGMGGGTNLMAPTPGASFTPVAGR
jgi:hypothetical protein